jgi:hypothetical protein
MSKLNKPQSSNSPLCFYGLEWLGGIEYRFNEEFMEKSRKGVMGNEKNH